MTQGRVFLHCFQALRTSCVGTHGKNRGDGGICPGSLVFLRMRLPELPSPPMAAAFRESGNLSLSWGVGREEESGGQRGGASGGDEGKTLWRGSFPFLYDIAKNQGCPVRGCIKTSQKSGRAASTAVSITLEKRNQKQKNFPGRSLASLSYMQLLARLQNLLDSH